MEWAVADGGVGGKWEWVVVAVAEAVGSEAYKNARARFIVPYGKRRRKTTKKRTKIKRGRTRLAALAPSN